MKASLSAARGLAMAEGVGPTTQPVAQLILNDFLPYVRSFEVAFRGSTVQYLSRRYGGSRACHPRNLSPKLCFLTS